MELYPVRQVALIYADSCYWQTFPTAGRYLFSCARASVMYRPSFVCPYHTESGQWYTPDLVLTQTMKCGLPAVGARGISLPPASFTRPGGETAFGTDRGSRCCRRITVRVVGMTKSSIRKTVAARAA